MRLRSKIVCTLSAVVVAYAATDFYVQRNAIFPSFIAVERHEAEEDMQRVLGAIADQERHLNATCRDWAYWDDTYAYVEEPSALYEASNLGKRTLEEHGIDFLYLCDLNGRVVWGDIREPLDRRRIRLHDFPSEAVDQTHPMVVSARKLEEDRERIEGRDAHNKSELLRELKSGGLLVTEHGPMLMSSRSIRTSAGAGEPRGTVILGRFLEGDLLTSLEKQTKVDFSVWPLHDETLPDDARGVQDEVSSSFRPVIREASDDLLYVYGSVADYRLQPALMVRADIERTIARTGKSALSYALNSTLAASLIMLLVLGGLIQKIILAPISALTRHAVEIGRTEDLGSPLALDREDEVGILSREFDDMCTKLAQSRADVVVAARSAGMSEIATGILHNVGNVLNSVNISANLVNKKLQKLGINDLAALVQVLEDNRDNLARFVTEDPRGMHMQPFLKSLAENMSKDREGMAGEVASLTSGLAHIRDLISSQQSYAGQSSLVEWTNLEDEIEKAIEICNKALSADKELEIRREFGDLPRVKIDRHKTFEILVNLLQNARQAMLNNDGERLLVVNVADDDEYIRVTVTDNGIGITPENLSKVFNMGFTTKKSGHGFGLHTSANAATEMGGALTVDSDGPGSGTTFTLVIPYERESTAQAVR